MLYDHFLSTSCHLSLLTTQMQTQGSQYDRRSSNSQLLYLEFLASPLESG